MPLPHSQHHPFDQLPKVIEPGRIAFTVWHLPTEGRSGDHYSFTWDGEHTAEWQVICDGPPREFMSGTARWPDGNDLFVTYAFSDAGTQRTTRRRGCAPTAYTPYSLRDPEMWIQLAGFIYIHPSRDR